MTRRAFILTNPDAIELGAEPLDKLRIALDRMFGLSPQAIERAVESRLFSEHARARLLREPRDWNYLDGPTLATHLRWSRAHPGLRAASFTEIRNELDASWPASVHGRVREAQVSTDFANALGNTLRRLLLSAYAEPLYGEETISRPGSTPDLRPQQLVGVNVGADIPTVDLEASNYPEAPKLAERNIGSFPVVQTGEIITISRKTIIISRKTIINDDINLVSRLISDKGRAARRTLARAIWAPWIANATYGEDGLAWFHANHSNAQSSAISETEVIAGIRKLLDQTQPGSAEKLGTRARPGSLYLDVPHALWDAAYKLNQTTAGGRAKTSPTLALGGSHDPPPPSVGF